MFKSFSSTSGASERPLAVLVLCHMVSTLFKTVFFFLPLQKRKKFKKMEETLDWKCSWTCHLLSYRESEKLTVVELHSYLSLTLFRHLLDFFFFWTLAPTSRHVPCLTAMPEDTKSTTSCLHVNTVL